MRRALRLSAALSAFVVASGVLVSCGSNGGGDAPPEGVTRTEPKQPEEATKPPAETPEAKPVAEAKAPTEAEEAKPAAPGAKIDDAALPVVRFETDRGRIVLELFEDDAPNTVANFINLAEKGYYDGLVFHRVIANFMIQGGDPTGTGRGGPGYRFRDEFSRRAHDGPGVLSMANSGPNTNGSQFFITHRATPHLDGRHTVFGRVTEGLEVVNAVRRGDAMRKVVVVRKRGHEYVPDIMK